jgi:hypothetical protein
MAKYRIGDVFKSKFSKRNYQIADIYGDTNATPSPGVLYILHAMAKSGPPSIQHSACETERTLSDHYEIIEK